MRKIKISYPPRIFHHWRRSRDKFAQKQMHREKYRLHNTIIHGSKEGINGSSSPPRKRKILARALIEAGPLLPRMKGDPRIIRSCEINWSSLE